MMHKLLRLARRDDMSLVLRAYVSLLVVDIGVRAIGILPIWRLICRRFRKTSAGSHPSPSEFARLRMAVASAARHHLYPMRCLPQALVLAWLLARRGVAVELRLGARLADGKLEAHAWLEHDGKELFSELVDHSPFRPLESTVALRTGT